MNTGLVFNRRRVLFTSENLNSEGGEEGGEIGGEIASVSENTFANRVITGLEDLGAGLKYFAIDELGILFESNFEVSRGFRCCFFLGEGLGRPCSARCDGNMRDLLKKVNNYRQAGRQMYKSVQKGISITHWSGPMWLGDSIGDWEGCLARRCNPIKL
jgi:hypothetical protein